MGFAALLTVREAMTRTGPSNSGKHFHITAAPAYRRHTEPVAQVAWGGHVELRSLLCVEDPRDPTAGW